MHGIIIVQIGDELTTSSGERAISSSGNATRLDPESLQMVIAEPLPKLEAPTIFDFLKTDFGAPVAEPVIY